METIKIEEVLLSIVIPTKDRYETLFRILDILLLIKSQNFEIIIQDNSFDTRPIRKYLQDKQDFRLKYFHNEGKLSQTENSNLAVGNSRGKYVCFIGDDDCVMEAIIDACKWMEIRSIDVLTFNLANYIWPDLISKSEEQKKMGVLKYVKPKGLYKVQNSKLELERLLERGGQNIKPLPQLYQAIVSRRLLKEIFNEAKTFFPGPSPDIAIATALAVHTKNHYLLDAPIIISGTSKRSAGGLGYQKLHEGDIRSISQLPTDTADKWNLNVPFFWSGATIYADSVLKSLEKTHHTGLKNRLNFDYLYATLLVFNGNYRSTTLRTMRSNPMSSRIRVLYYILTLLLLRTKFYIKNRVPFLIGNNNKIVSLPSIEEAVLYLKDELKNIQLPWQT
ncbi:MAG: glycosyltransferase family 2 protein [Ginsengibacter sp.]